MNIFWGAQIVICIQLDFAAACVFVYFEYIQIFIFSLHSMAAHALRMNFHKPLLSHTFTFMTSTHRQSFHNEPIQCQTLTPHYCSQLSFMRTCDGL